MTATIGLTVFLHLYFIPFIKRKCLFWFWSKKIKRMSKKHDDEIGQDLKEISDDLMDVCRDEKMVDDNE